MSAADMQDSSARTPSARRAEASALLDDYDAARKAWLLVNSLNIAEESGLIAEWNAALDRVEDLRARLLATLDTPPLASREPFSEDTAVAWAVLADDNTAIDLGWTEDHMRACIKKRCDLALAGGPYRVVPLHAGAARTPSPEQT